MKKQRTTKVDQTVAKAKRAAPAMKRRASPTDYADVLADMKRLIADSRHRALATVNRELVGLYWHIGRVIVEQQETAHWGDAVVEQLATDLRMAFPDMKGLSLPNIWKMRQFYRSCREVDRWLAASTSTEIVGALRRQLESSQELSTAPRELQHASSGHGILSTLSRELSSPNLVEAISRLSWSQHAEILAASAEPPERYFYTAMSARERWSVRELRRQIDSGLFLRYMSVKRDPEKCLPAEAEAESGDLLPFKDHYILEFLGLSEEHSEKQLRKAILANLDRIPRRLVSVNRRTVMDQTTMLNLNDNTPAKNLRSGATT